ERLHHRARARRRHEARAGVADAGTAHDRGAVRRIRAAGLLGRQWGAAHRRPANRAAGVRDPLGGGGLAMSADSVNVRVVPPDATSDELAIARIYDADFALLDERPVQEELEVPPGTGYVASALGRDGRPLGLPTRFDAPPDGDKHINVKLEA